MTDRTEWTSLLRDFTQRNAGRIATLEVDDPDFGAQIQDASHPLLGVTYDSRDERVEIMLGEQGSTENRLTHTIPGPTSVECATDMSGETLRVASGNTHTLLRVR